MNDAATKYEVKRDQARASDWFPATENSVRSQNATLGSTIDLIRDVGFGNSSARFGWVYKPETSNASGPNTIDRLLWFLTTNRTRLLRDLLEVVNLNNINHENICCLNTAVVITIFANRRHELHDLLKGLKQMDNDEQNARLHHSKLSNEGQNHAGDTPNSSSSNNNNRNSILQNFRKVLWFWVEYYTHRGRDRLSLEFSSRLRFHEWMEVVTLLAADDGTPTALVQKPLALPQSPYQRIA
jgi:Trpc4-associated protein